MKEENYRIALMILMVSALFFMAPPSAQAGEHKPKERLAVLNLEAKYGIDKELGLTEALSVIVRDALHGFGDFQVMSTEDIQAVASREQLLQAMGCDDGGNQCLIDFGRALGTRFMVAGDVSKLGSTYTISLRMIDTAGESPGVINRASESCKCNEDALITTAKEVAARLVGKPSISADKKDEEMKRLTAEKKKSLETETKHQTILAEGQRTAEQKKATVSEKLRRTEVDKRYILDKMERYDRQQLNNAFEYLRSGSTAQWRNQMTDTGYEVTPQPAFSLADEPERPCRKAEIIATTGQNATITTATACRNNDAQWIFLN